ncbi:hypothetical protein D3C73_830100 [compost metagenome]
MPERIAELAGNKGDRLLQAARQQHADGNRFRQLHPQVQPALRRRPLPAAPRQLLLHNLFMHLQRNPQLAQMLLQARRGVIVQENLLVQQRRAVVGQRFGGNQPLHERMAAGHRTDPQAWSHVFAEAADIDDPALCIVGKERGRGRITEIDVPEGIILYQQTAVLLRQLHQQLALARRNGEAGRIVMGRIHIEHPRPVPPHQFLYRRQIIALRRDPDRQQPGARPAENIQRHAVRRLLHQHMIQRAEHDPRDQIDRLLRP